MIDFIIIITIIIYYFRFVVYLLFFVSASLKRKFARKCRIFSESIHTHTWQIHDHIESFKIFLTLKWKSDWALLAPSEKALLLSLTPFHTLLLSLCWPSTDKMYLFYYIKLNNNKNNIFYVYNCYIVLSLRHLQLHPSPAFQSFMVQVWWFLR